jgi:hypothetical protein
MSTTRKFKYLSYSRQWKIDNNVVISLVNIPNSLLDDRPYFFFCSLHELLPITGIVVIKQTNEDSLFLEY